MSGALEGIQVVDFGQYIAGPLAAVMLAEQGADVVHVDPPGGPRWNVPADAFLNRSKRRISLDLKSQQDLATAQQLVERADVLIENFRPGVMDRLHLGPHVATDSNKRLIYCSMPGFAPDDPRAGMQAWEGIVDAATGNCRPRAGEAPPDWDSSRPTYSAIPLASNFAAFLAATSVVMALIARHKTGVGQRIEVPLFHAMFTAIGPAGAYPTERGLREPRPIDVNGSGTYRCGDGRYIQFDPSNHRFLTWFAQAAGISQWGADLLDIECLKEPRNNERLHERLVALFLTRSSFEWETLANDVGAVLAAVRSDTEWLSNDHARILGAVTQLADPILGPTRMAGLPVQLLGSPGAVRHSRHLPDADHQAILAELDDAPRSEASHAAVTPSAALAGVRVLDLTQVLAGPTSGRLLAEFGADVIKINGPQRRIGSHGYLNRGKRSILLDVESTAGQQAFWKLLERADVVIQNFPKGTPERYGIGYEQLRARKPDIIYTSLSCYGYGGPWGGGRGYERQAQAVAGVMDRVGVVPAILGPYNLVDIGTGVLTAFAASLALLHKARTGQGQHVQTSLCQTATYHQTIYALDYAGAVRDEPRGWEALGSGPRQRFYQASDGWFFLGASDSDTTRLDRLAGTDDARDLEAAFAQRPMAHWVDCLRQADISAQAVVNLPDLMRDPWVREHGLSISQLSDEAGDVTYPGASVTLSATPMRIGPAARRPGGDAYDVFSEIGSTDMIPALERAWALQIADPPPGW
jgi:crotonobetainyl-CoA:carnitine CoA-transferase CaiB-like acyl-CoA transferase